MKSADIAETLTTLRKSKNIVLVEDSSIDRLNARITLESLGCTVVEFECGEDAIDYLRVNNPPDGIVTDLRMDGMGGLALANQAREMFPNMPILIYSSIDTSALRALEDNFLVSPKPLSVKLLQGICEQFGKKYHHQQV